MEDVDGVYCWVGPPLKDDSTKTSFPGLLVQYKIRGKSRNNNLCLFVIGSKVLVYNGDKIPYIGEIVELYYDKVKKKMLTKLRWFYRYHDAKVHHRFTHSPPHHEIFYSSHYDINEVNILKSPCYVIFLPEKQPLPLTGKCYQNTFICRYELTFPGVSCFNNDKLKFEIERDFPFFPLQLQHLLFNDRKFWLNIESITENLNVSYQFSPSCEVETKVNSTEIISDRNYKEIHLDTTNEDEKFSFGTSASNTTENLNDSSIDDDLYFSSQIPPTKLTRVRPFDMDVIDEPTKLEPIAIAVKNGGSTSKEVANVSVCFTSVKQSSTTENGLELNKQKEEVILEYFNPIDERRMHGQDNFDIGDSLLRRQSQPILLEDDSDVKYIIDDNVGHSKGVLPPLLSGRSFQSISPNTDLSPTTYLSTPNKVSTHSKFPHTNSMNGSLLDLNESDSSEIEDNNTEQHYIDNAANNIPPCLPPLPMKIDFKKDILWAPCEAIYLYGVDISFALELLIQPIVQSVLLSSLKQFQQNLGSSSHRLIVDGSLALLTGVDVYGLFHELLYQHLPNRNIIELQPVLPRVMDELKAKLLPFVTLWSVQEQDILYTLCRTPERSSHIINLPLRRAQRKLVSKSRKEIIDFFAKYIDNGRYLDIVLNHEGFAYHLIHSDLTLEDALALSHSDEYDHINYKKVSGSHGNDSPSQSSQMFSLEDSICSEEEERWRRTLYWAKWDKQENPASSQEDLYGFKLRVVDSLMAQLQTGTRRKASTSSGPRIFPYLSMNEFSERNSKENVESKINSEANEILCQKFFVRIAAIMDELSFHQFCCTLLLWQRTCITIGAMVVRVSHIIADAIVEDEEVNNIPVEDILNRYRLIQNLKKDLYLQFKVLISSTSIQRFQLPHFEL